MNKPINVAILITYMLIFNQSFAKVGWYLNIFNNSNKPILATDLNAGGNLHGNPKDLNKNGRFIEPNQIGTVYSEEQNYDPHCIHSKHNNCFKKFQKFILGNAKLSIASDYYNERYIYSYNQHKYLSYYKSSKINEVTDTVILEVRYNSPNDIQVTSSSWK